jgi:hypothetical protein
MSRTVLTALLALAVYAVSTQAKEYKDATVTSVDAEKNVIVAKIGDKEVTFAFTDKTTFLRNNGQEIARDKLAETTKRIVGDKGRPAVIVTEEKDDKEVTKDGKPVVSKITFGKKQ